MKALFCVCVCGGGVIDKSIDFEKASKQLSI